MKITLLTNLRLQAHKAGQGKRQAEQIAQSK